MSLPMFFRPENIEALSRRSLGLEKEDPKENQRRERKYDLERLEENSVMNETEIGHKESRLRNILDHMKVLQKPRNKLNQENKHLTSKSFKSLKRHTNKDLGMGLHPEDISDHWPGLTLGESALRKFVDVGDSQAIGVEQNPRTVLEMSDDGVEQRFFQLIRMKHVNCSNQKRIGNIGDGGWDLCTSDPYEPKEGCLVYSFGIGYDFSFDDSTGKEYGCEVRSFDPTMNISSHRRSKYVYFHNLGIGGKGVWNGKEWQSKTLTSILDTNGHLHRTIDFLKMDIEFNEWDSLKEMFRSNALRNVKQFALEIHLRLYKNKKANYQRFYNILLGIEKQGFRRFHYHQNPACMENSKLTGKRISVCHELYYININFLKQTEPTTSWNLAKISKTYFIYPSLAMIVLFWFYAFYILECNSAKSKCCC